MREVTSWLVLAIVCLLAASQTGWAATREFFPPQAGIWLDPTPERHCDSSCQQQLLASLQRITGLQQLQVSSVGELKVCDWAATAGGSASARALLFRALQSGDAYVVEAHPGSPEVTFGQLDAGLIYESLEDAQRLTIWRLRLDLEDFKRVEAPAPVLASFDVGFAFLHELLHGLGYDDAATLDELGPCEELINQVRTELSLPLRAQYYGDVLTITARIFTVKLLFHDPPPALAEGSSIAGKRTKRRTYQLFFAPEMGTSYQLLKDTHTNNLLRRR